MSAHAEHCKLDNELTLRDPSASPLTLRAVHLMLTKQQDTLSECRLTFQLSPELYQRIDTEALFNLKPQLRGPFSAGPFQPEPDIEIEATLQPDLLPHLTNHTANPDGAAAYLQNLCQEQPDNPLLSTESWFGVHIKQLIESGEIGYRTLWSYVSLSVITQEAASRGEISQAMINFFKFFLDVWLWLRFGRFWFRQAWQLEHQLQYRRAGATGSGSGVGAGERRWCWLNQSNCTVRELYCQRISENFNLSWINVVEHHQGCISLAKRRLDSLLDRK
jgi:hypothetical protein